LESAQVLLAINTANYKKKQHDRFTAINTRFKNITVRI
jgi:hypothetical protein